MNPMNQTIRQLRQTSFQTAPVSVDTLAQNLIAWFEQQPSVGSQAWLLTHSEVGVIWGRAEEGRLLLANEIFGDDVPSLQLNTLQEARLFGEQAEVRLWRIDDGFQACRISDQPGIGEAFDECHHLWGTQIVKKDSNAVQRQRGFTMMVDGREGLRHAPPVEVPDQVLGNQRGNLRYRPVRLCTRHYIDYDLQTGQAFIPMTRLVRLQVVSRS
ncbi:MAG: TIGR03984 family CRISPR-associated protein [Chloroflexi bacterium]|nr:MAG: TIGR03984 family CRISPR-associated protein [Chloroflexota bacterium]